MTDHGYADPFDVVSYTKTATYPANNSGSAGLAGLNIVAPANPAVALNANTIDLDFREAGLYSITLTADPQAAVPTVAMVGAMIGLSGADVGLVLPGDLPINKTVSASVTRYFAVSQQARILLWSVGLVATLDVAFQIDIALIGPATP